MFDAILDFESDEVLTFTTSAGRTETVQITAIRLRNKLWEVYWQEASGLATRSAGVHVIPESDLPLERHLELAACGSDLHSGGRASSKFRPEPETRRSGG